MIFYTMKILSKSGVLRLLTVVVAFLTFGYVNAANRLYIDDFTISGTEPVRVAVMLDNTDEVGALQFNLLLPQGLTMVGTPERNNERFNPSQNMLFNPNKSNMFLVTSGDRKPFLGNTGAICYFYVQADPAVLAAGKPLSISLANIVLSTGSGQKLENEGGKQTNTQVKVQNGTAKLSSASQVFINPEGKQRISVSMSNDFEVQGLQLEIVLPEGFSIAGETLNKGARLSEGSNLALVPNKHDAFTYGAVITDWTGKNAVTGNDGELFWFEIVAPAGFEAESAMVTFTNLKCATPLNKTIAGEGCAVLVKNGLPAYNRALGEIAALEKALQDALEVIATEAPNVKDQFPGTEITASIEALKAAVDEAYANLTLTDDYDNVMAPVPAINAAIAKLIEDAMAAQAEYNAEVARQEAFTNANAEIAKLEAALADALTEIANAAPDVKDDFKGEEISDQIEDLKEAVNKAYEDKTIADKYDELMAPTATINDAITQLIEDAKAAQARFVALTNANAEIAKLEAALADALTEIATAAPDVKDDFKGEEISDQIEDLKEAVNKAYEDKTIVENYDELMAPTAAINAAIAKLIEDAKAAQADYEDQLRRAANQAAYEADMEIIKGLQQKLDIAVDMIKMVYPDYDVETAAKAVQDAIDAEADKAAAALAAVEEEGTYENTVDSAAIEAMIEKLKEEAKTSGISMVPGEALGEGARIFTLDGVQVQTLQQGKVNIVVYPNGSKEKVFIK